jgi:hypothetical protein
MKAGGFPLPAFISFFIGICTRRRIGQAAACKAVAPREHGGSSPPWCIFGRLGTGRPSSPENCRGASPCGFDSHTFRQSNGGAAQKVVQRRAKPPGAKAPLCVRVAPPPLYSFEPVAQKDQSAGLRSLRPHVRVVPGSLLFRGRLKGGRLSLKQVMEVRLLPPESLKSFAGVA